MLINHRSSYKVLSTNKTIIIIPRAKKGASNDFVIVKDSASHTLSIMVNIQGYDEKGLITKALRTLNLETFNKFTDTYVDYDNFASAVRLAKSHCRTLIEGRKDPETIVDGVSRRSKDVTIVTQFGDLSSVYMQDVNDKIAFIITREGLAIKALVKRRLSKAKLLDTKKISTFVNHQHGKLLRVYSSWRKTLASESERMQKLMDLAKDPFI